MLPQEHTTFLVVTTEVERLPAMHRTPSPNPTKLKRPVWGTRQEAAQYLCCSIATVDRLITEKRLKAKRLSARAVRIDMTTIDDALSPIGGAA